MQALWQYRLTGTILSLLMTISLAAGDEPKTRNLLEGGARDWILCDQNPLPASFVQQDGLNPHKTGSYLVVHNEKVADFILDFEYKLTPGCNSGVFLRVSDLKNPVNTGIEIALDDTKGNGMHDSGAFYDLVAPRSNAQKPAGEWNHMVIHAAGSKISVTLNGVEVSSIDLDSWGDPGKRPDGSSHKFQDVAIGKLPRTGYFGFQDHGSDCWFRNIKLKALPNTP